MKFAQEKVMNPVYAARLVDNLYKVEVGLYPLPETVEQLNLVLSHLDSMPHTPEEKESILQRLASVGKTLLPEAAEYETLFGDTQPSETEDPVDISLSEKNYALLYSAVQFCPETICTVGPLVTAEAEEDEDDEPAAEPAEALDVEALVSSVKEGLAETFKAELATALDSLKEQLEALKPAEVAPTDEGAETTEEDLTELEQLRADLAEANTARIKSLADTVALYWRTLRKPQARDKSMEQLSDLLVARGESYLEHALEDLKVEMDAGSTGIATVTQVQNPLGGEAAASPTPEPTADDAVPAQDPNEGLDAMELDDEEDTIQIFYPNLKR